MDSKVDHSRGAYDLYLLRRVENNNPARHNPSKPTSIDGSATAAIYVSVQLAIVFNVIAVTVQLERYGWPLLAALLPYAIFLPRITKVLRTHHNDPPGLLGVAKANVQLHLLFALLLNLSMLAVVTLW